MKRSLNIGSLLLVFVLCGSLGCRSWCERWADEGRVKPEHQSGILKPVLITKAGSAAGVKPVAVRLPAEIPVVRATAAVGGTNGPYVVSRIYPCAECAVIRLDKTMPEELEPNKPFDYFIKFTNLTDMVLTGVLITEDLSDNYKFTSSNPVARRQANRLVWEVDLLEPRATKQITVSGMATEGTEGGYLKHCTTVITQVIPACASVKVIQPRLELARISPTEAVICDTIPVKFAIFNSGTTTVQNVRIVDTLPDGLQTSDGKNEIVFDVGTLTPGQSRQYSAELRAAKAGKYVCQAAATSPAGPRAETPATTITVGQPVLAVTQSGPERHYLGRPLTYEITVTNKGDGAARNTVVENTFPPTAISIKATSGAKLSDSKVLWQLGTVAPGASRTVRVSYMPTGAGTLVSNTNATAYCTDAATASVQTAVSGIAGVLLEVGDVDDPVEVNGRTTYLITVTNQGSAPSTNIRISCTLEDSVQYVSSAGPTTGTLEGSTVKFAPLDSLAPRGKATWQVVVTAVKAGDIRFKATMITDQLTRPVEETEATHLYD